MKVIVRNAEYGGVIVDQAIEHPLPISMDREEDGSLRLYVWDKDAVDSTIAWFAKGGWRSAWIADAPELDLDEPVGVLPDNSEFHDEHPL